MDVAELARQVEYKAAPEPLIAVQGLANTFAFEPEEERLIDAGSAREWLVRSELATAEVEVGEREHATLLECRAVVRSLLDANLSGRIEAKTVSALARLAADHPPVLAVGEDGVLTLDLTPQSTVDGVISQLLGIVYQAQVEGRWPRLKVCASDDCRWAFYDTSKNRSGTWCKMEICGNRVKNRAYRRRRQTQS